jgi:pyruvate,water dikinase
MHQNGTAGNPPPAPTPLVLPLLRLGRGDLGIAGGKGANLGELVRAGFPVPPGFVVTTAAYDRVVEHAGLDETIARVLRDEHGGAAIRSAFEAAPIPPEIEREVLAAYERLGQGPVAVRSSATAEDLPRAAFAGQHESFLNVRGTDALLDAVRRCWASLWTDRAIAYRTRLGLDQRAVKLAVVVQRMVPAEAAGVLFTANPVTGATDEVVIDVSRGLGEAVVSGLVTPDHIVLRRRWLNRWGWRVVEHRPGQREIIVRPRAAGGTERVAPEAGSAAQPLLPKRALSELARLGVAIQRHFGLPQDIEWAWAEGSVFILQARTITALPAPLAQPGHMQRLMAGIVAELLPARPYPLEATTWGIEYVVSALLGPAFRSLGISVCFRRAFPEDDGVILHFRGQVPYRPTPGLLLAPFRLLRLARRFNPARWRSDPLLAEAQARARALEARDLQSLAWDAVLATVHEALAVPPLVGALRNRYLLPRLPAVAGLRIFLSLLRAGNRFGTLLFTGIETRTLEANHVLAALANRIRSDPALARLFARYDPQDLWAALEAEPAGRALLAELRAFLDAYGHRETGGTLQVSQPTWKDAPEVVLAMLQGLARTAPRRQPRRPAWEVTRDELLAHPLLRLPLLRSAFLGLLADARWFPQIREDTRFYATLTLPVLRRALLELGRRLAQVHVLATHADVFHLKLSELEQVGGTWPPSPRIARHLRARVVRRIAKRAELERVPFIDPRLLGEPGEAGNVLLRGTPGSPGIAEGPVRVIRAASEFGTLQAGEVLVAPFTSPAWTPLFERAAAVVVDSGGPASHAAIVAREYGIPAVMATVDGTRRLTDGQRVRVDGAAGLVFGVGPQPGEGATAPSVDR